VLRGAGHYATNRENNDEPPYVHPHIPPC
jgi:hypothetical protein